MSKVKRVKRENAAKDAIKKNRKSHSRASKFKKAELKATLDGQTHLLYATMSKASSGILPSAETSIQNLTAVLGNL